MMGDHRYGVRPPSKCDFKILLFYIKVHICVMLYRIESKLKVVYNNLHSNLLHDQSGMSGHVNRLAVVLYMLRYYCRLNEWWTKIYVFTEQIRPQ